MQEHHTLPLVQVFELSGTPRPSSFCPGSLRHQYGSNAAARAASKAHLLATQIPQLHQAPRCSVGADPCPRRPCRPTRTTAKQCSILSCNVKQTHTSVRTAPGVERLNASTCQPRVRWHDSASQQEECATGHVRLVRLRCRSVTFVHSFCIGSTGLCGLTPAAPLYVGDVCRSMGGTWSPTYSVDDAKRSFQALGMSACCMLADEEHDAACLSRTVCKSLWLESRIPLTAFSLPLASQLGWCTAAEDVLVITIQFFLCHKDRTFEHPNLIAFRMFAFTARQYASSPGKAKNTLIVVDPTCVCLIGLVKSCQGQRYSRRALNTTCCMHTQRHFRYAFPTDSGDRIS
jgi:hypothetical protein